MCGRLQKGGFSMKRHTHRAIAILLVILAAAASLRADDTEIYGVVSTPSIPPNVLIIFDTSGSMSTRDVPGDPYVPAMTYSGSYITNAVYQRVTIGHSYQWVVFTDSIDNISCASIKTDLLSIGYWAGKTSAPTFKCNSGNTQRRLRLGNFMNYDVSGVGLAKTRISVAKEVLTNLISQTNDVRFGMMVYNYNDSDATSGGRLLAPCADRLDSAAKQPLLDAVASATPSGWTPLAETMAEAGLYFAGKPSWFNTGVTYTSPMQQRCQKNYIILMTDGEPTIDRHHKLYDTPYINGDLIGDQDGDHSAPCAGSGYDDLYNDVTKSFSTTYMPFGTHEYWYRDGNGNCQFYPDAGSDYLDDVARYLYRNDCNQDLGAGTSFEKQNVITYTIGFRIQNQLLSRTAAHGGGEYFTADNYSALSEAFNQIMAAIVERNSCFVAPVVPVSRTNRTYAGNKIYLGFFKPQQDGRWFGNVKRYKLDNDGSIRDQANILATNASGLIQENARSWWSSADDGPAVERGGAAERLGILIDTGGTRNIYTYTGTNALLTDSSNAFAYSNSAISNGMLDVTDSARTLLFDTVHKGEFGDVIHSEPAVVYYGAGADGLPDTADDVVKIFVGANDGMLHCIDDVTGNEDWAFIPPDHLEKLKKLADTVPDHDYFVDGSPTVHYSDSRKILIIGSRRGGESYTAIDITTYNAPRYLYTVGPTVLGSGNERLGQSWSRPEKATIATGATVTTAGCSVVQQFDGSNTADVLLLGGGYDTNQDIRTAPFQADTEGRAVFAVSLTAGTLMNNLKFSNGAPISLGMSNSVVDVAGFDHDGDGIVSRIYFGDLGGNVFALRDDVIQEFTLCSKTITKSVVDGTWAGVKLFNASADGVKRKIFYAPDAVAETYPPGTQGEYIYFGTGDREDPGNTAVVNRIYAVKNDWTATSALTESDLVNVTENLIQLGTAEEKTQVRSLLNTQKGWFIELENLGEKVVSSPRVYGGVVYFTTYTPGQGEVSADPCEASTANGVARLYAVDFKTGGAVHNFSTTPEIDGSGNTVALGKLDRSTVIGTAIPSAPVIAILRSGAYLFIGVEGGISSMPVVAGQDMYRYYWNQIF
jgi:type IV pilus assembly protein PilY1